MLGQVLFLNRLHELAISHGADQETHNEDEDGTHLSEASAAAEVVSPRSLVTDIKKTEAPWSELV